MHTRAIYSETLQHSTCFNKTVAKRLCRAKFHHHQEKQHDFSSEAYKYIYIYIKEKRKEEEEGV
jgi:transcription elongation factor